MTGAATPAYRRLSVEERRGQLLEAAQELFAHRSPEDVSLDDVAEAAGVSRPLVYRYFPGGKQQLYEAALRSSADALNHCFTEPPAGPPTERLGRVLDRYLAFVDEHDAGFSALLRGGSVAETSRTTAIVDEVRRAAAGQILVHLGVERPGPRLGMLVRTWIAAVEAASSSGSTRTSGPLPGSCGSGSSTISSPCSRRPRRATRRRLGSSGDSSRRRRPRARWRGWPAG